MDRGNSRSELSGTNPGGVAGNIKNNLERIPSPLSRHDGLYKYDGALKYGGEFGGALRKCLKLNSKYNHEAALINSRIPDQDPRKNKIRKKEFDIEHLETALEGEIDFFISLDYKLKRRLENCFKKYKDEFVKKAYDIIRTPSEFLKEI